MFDNITTASVTRTPHPICTRSLASTPHKYITAVQCFEIYEEAFDAGGRELEWEYALIESPR